MNKVVLLGSWMALAGGFARADADAQAAPQGVALVPRVVACASVGLGWNHCAMETGDGVVLVRNLSDESPCIRGTDWGVDASGIWVARGCSGEFRSGAAAAGDGSTRRLVRCESDDVRMQSCPIKLRGAPVRLYRQLSSFPCKQDKTWGVGRNEIWVTRGCRAEFELGAEDGSGFALGGQRVVCESNKGRRQRCNVGVTLGVTLDKRLSRAECVEGQGWGWDRDGIWVDDGCRAEFLVR